MHAKQLFNGLKSKNLKSKHDEIKFFIDQYIQYEWEFVKFLKVFMEEIIFYEVHSVDKGK